MEPLKKNDKIITIIALIFRCNIFHYNYYYYNNIIIFYNKKKLLPMEIYV